MTARSSEQVDVLMISLRDLTKLRETRVALLTVCIFGCIVFPGTFATKENSRQYHLVEKLTDGVHVM